MILRTLARMLWVAFAFLISALVAIPLLFALGGVWAGEELRALLPDDPVLAQAMPVFGTMVFVGTVAHALTALPAVLAVIVGEALRIRSWMYYVLAGGAVVAAIPLLASPQHEGLPNPAEAQWLTIFAAAGFAGGFVYWLLAGRKA